MGKKLTDEEQKKRLERLTEAANRQAGAALGAAKFVKDSLGRYHPDFPEARRWIKVAQEHFIEASGILDMIEEQP